MSRGILPTPPRSVLLVRLSARGDIVFSSPLVRAFRRTYPNTRLTWMAESHTKDLIEHHPELDEVIVVDRDRWKALWRQRRFRTLGKEVRELVRESPKQKVRRGHRSPGPAPKRHPDLPLGSTHPDRLGLQGGKQTPHDPGSLPHRRGPPEDQLRIPVPGRGTGVGGRGLQNGGPPCRSRQELGGGQGRRAGPGGGLSGRPSLHHHPSETLAGEPLGRAHGPGHGRSSAFRRWFSGDPRTGRPWIGSGRWPASSR